MLEMNIKYFIAEILLKYFMLKTPIKTAKLWNGMQMRSL